GSPQTSVGAWGALQASGISVALPVALRARVRAYRSQSRAALRNSQIGHVRLECLGTERLLTSPPRAGRKLGRPGTVIVNRVHWLGNTPRRPTRPRMAWLLSRTARSARQRQRWELPIVDRTAGMNRRRPRMRAITRETLPQISQPGISHSTPVGL